MKTLATAVIFSQLVACGGGDGNSTSSGNGTETALANAVEITGSVGDGPIIGATVEVYSADGELLDTTLTDSRSSYTKKIKAKGKDFPLTIKATGGTDLVTGAAPDFDLYSLMMSPSQKIVNLNPYTLFVVKIARDMPGGINDSNLEAAMASVIDELGFGIDPGLVGDVIRDQVTESTVANVVKGSEVFSEMIRRTRDKYLVTGTAITANEVIVALAADMTDGVLDGEGVSGCKSEDYSYRQGCICAGSAGSIKEQAESRWIDCNGYDQSGDHHDPARDITLTAYQQCEDYPAYDRTAEGVTCDCTVD